MAQLVEHKTGDQRVASSRLTRDQGPNYVYAFNACAYNSAL